MSFSEMMSSARGPGVIGTLMALAVLAIFVMFFVFAFDDRFQGGGQSIQSVIAQQGRDIEADQFAVTEGQKTLSGFPALMASAKDLSRLNRENEALQGRVDTLRNHVESGNAELARKIEGFEAYKDRYRALVRANAKGEVMETLETQTGVVYKDVNIREVTAIGIQILHEGGQKRIAYEELPMSMQDHYQFDSRQKTAALASEQATWNEHVAAGEAAAKAADQQTDEQTKKATVELRAQMRQALAVQVARTQSLTTEISQLEMAIRNEKLKGISRAPEMRAKLAEKQRELSALRVEVARLKAAQ